MFTSRPRAVPLETWVDLFGRDRGSYIHWLLKEHDVYHPPLVFVLLSLIVAKLHVNWKVDGGIKDLWGYGDDKLRGVFWSYEFGLMGVHEVPPEIPHGYEWSKDSVDFSYDDVKRLLDLRRLAPSDFYILTTTKGMSDEDVRRQFTFLMYGQVETVLSRQITPYDPVRPIGIQTSFTGPFDQKRAFYDFASKTWSLRAYGTP